jgi:hypothetical protein
VIPRRLYFKSQRFGTFCLLERSKTVAFKLQTPGKHTEKSIRHSAQGESLKSTNSFPFDGFSLNFTFQFFKNLPRKLNFHNNLTTTTTTCTLHEDLWALMIVR